MHFEQTIRKWLSFEALNGRCSLFVCVCVRARVCVRTRVQTYHMYAYNHTADSSQVSVFLVRIVLPFRYFVGYVTNATLQLLLLLL